MHERGKWRQFVFQGYVVVQTIVVIMLFLNAVLEYPHGVRSEITPFLTCGMLLILSLGMFLRIKLAAIIFSALAFCLFIFLLLPQKGEDRIGLVPVGLFSLLPLIFTIIGWKILRPIRMISGERRAGDVSHNR